MATKVIVLEYDSNGTGLTYVGSSTSELGDSLYIASTADMSNLLFRTDKDTWTQYSVTERVFEESDGADTLANKPLNYTAYDGGSTYSVGTLIKSELFTLAGTGWELAGSVSYSSLASDTKVTGLVTQGYSVKGIIFL
jgi:hypothetical protein